MDEQRNWIIAKKRMMDALTRLGFPEALGDQIVRNLGSPKAMERMTSYLNNVKPKKAELVVDEMLAIWSDIARWKESHIYDDDYGCEKCMRGDKKVILYIVNDEIVGE